MYKYDLFEVSVARGRGIREATRLPRETKQQNEDETPELKPQLEAKDLVSKDLNWTPRSYPANHPLAPINEDLCHSCRRALEGTGTESFNILPNNTNGAFLEHLDGYFLKKSAHSGCSMCVFIWNAHRRTREILAQAEDIPLRYDFGSFVGGDDKGKLFAIKFYPFSLLENEKGQMGILLMPTITLTLDPRLENASSFDHPKSIDTDGLDVEATSKKRLQGISSTGDEDSIRQIKKWINGCTCIDANGSQSSSNQERFAPYRVIDTDESRPEEIRIINGNSTPLASRYIVLSHCWGTGQAGVPPIYKLLTSNLEELNRGVPISDLPKTFRDVVAVTRSLGVRYIWIDSLCIIQDSDSDWKRNAVVMWKVYRYSFITLAATAAQNSSQGLFRTRLAASVSPCRVHVPEDHGQIDAGKYTVYDHKEWLQFIEYAPLNRRAWVFQERMVSPRIVHFAENKLYFECREFRASEQFPHALPDRLAVYRLRERLPQELSEDPQESLLTLWNSIVQIYTGLDITYNSDKMVALSAVARQISWSLPLSGRYLAGLWEYSLLGQLCWESSLETTRADARKGPSWSWITVDGPITAEFVDLERVGARNEARAIASVIDVDVTYDTDIFISVSSGTLQLSGPLFLFKTMEPRGEQPGRDVDAKSTDESRGNAVRSLGRVIPGYEGEGLKSYGYSRDGLPTGPSGKNRIDLDASAGALVEYGSGKYVETDQTPTSPLRNFELDLGDGYGQGSLVLDRDVERGELEKLRPVFMPLYCTLDAYNEFDTLSGIVLVEAGNGDDAAAGMYRRIGVGRLNTYGIPPFLVALANQDYDASVAVDETRAKAFDLPRTGMLSLGDFAPERWFGRNLDALPKNFTRYKVCIV